MKLPLYIVDAFAQRIFTGNPAGVCLLNEWLDDKTMQNIAAENNAAETAFIVKEPEGLRIRWFTPKAEVELCGHATLASAHVFFQHLDHPGNVISFNSLSGPLSVTRDGETLTLDFPTDNIKQIEIPDYLLKAFEERPLEAYEGNFDYMLIYENQKQIEDADPAIDLLLKNCGTRCVIITAKGNDADFVSRYFAPYYGINEDHATGSAHTTLIPYWHKVTGKEMMNAIQLSPRGAEFSCRYLGERVKIGGKAFTYSHGQILI